MSKTPRLQVDQAQGHRIQEKSMWKIWQSKRNREKKIIVTFQSTIKFMKFIGAKEHKGWYRNKYCPLVTNSDTEGT